MVSLSLRRSIIVATALAILLLVVVVYAYESGVYITPPYDYGFYYESDPNDVDAYVKPSTGYCSISVHADSGETNEGIAGVAETLYFRPETGYNLHVTFRVRVDGYEEGASGSGSYSPYICVYAYDEDTGQVIIDQCKLSSYCVASGDMLDCFFSTDIRVIDVLYHDIHIKAYLYLKASGGSWWWQSIDAYMKGTISEVEVFGS